MDIGKLPFTEGHLNPKNLFQGPKIVDDWKPYQTQIASNTLDFLITMAIGCAIVGDYLVERKKTIERGTEEYNKLKENLEEIFSKLLEAYLKRCKLIYFDKLIPPIDLVEQRILYRTNMGDKK